MTDSARTEDNACGELLEVCRLRGWQFFLIMNFDKCNRCKARIIVRNCQS